MGTFVTGITSIGHTPTPGAPVLLPARAVNALVFDEGVVAEHVEETVTDAANASVPRYIRVRFDSIAIGSGTKPDDGASIAIANPGAQAPILSIETSGNNIAIITYDPNGGAPIVRIGGGSPMAQNILIEADDEVKLKAGSLDLKVDAATTGTVRVSGGPLRLASYTVAGLPSASTTGAGSMIHVSDESGGAVIAFSDGASWRRVTDRAVVS